MNQGDKPDLLIFHGPNCLDGIASRWALWQKWPDVAAYRGVYGQPPPDVTGLRVLIADFSYPEDVLREMAAVAASVTLLDHHEGSREAVLKLFNENVIRGDHDLTRSGAALTWEYVWGNRHPPKLIEHIQDRDLWKWQLEHTREITAVAAAIGDEMPAWTALARQVEGGERQLVIREGAAILRQRDRDIEAAIKAGRREMIIGGHRVPVCNAPYFWASDIGHVLAEGAPFAATYMDLPNGRQFSLRSREGGENVNLIAKEYGGGGHPGAAGFMAPKGWEGDIDQEEDEPIETITLKPGAQIPVKEG